MGHSRQHSLFDITSRCLVLNCDLTPINICHWRRAFLLVYKGKAEAVKTDGARTIDRRFVRPSIIRLKKQVFIPFHPVSLSRKNIFLRDAYSCQYCGKASGLTIDHIIPKARGGGDSWQNIILACGRCNNLKGNNLPQEAGLTLKRRPFKPPSKLYLELTRHAQTPANWYDYFPRLRTDQAGSFAARIELTVSNNSLTSKGLTR